MNARRVSRQRYEGYFKVPESGDAQQKPKGLFGKLPVVPLSFLGLGVYRAWIEIVFVGSFVDFPITQYSTRDIFDIVMTLTLFGVAICARKIGPFYNKRSVYWISGITLTLATVMVFWSMVQPELAYQFAVASSLLGGVGIALIILMWSELYGCLNPLRIALYYSAAIIVGALLIYIYRGFAFPWLFVMTSLLPAVSLLMVWRGFCFLPDAEKPSLSWSRFSIPWKAIILMSLYAFAYGLMENHLYSGFLGPHSAFGTVIIAAVVFLGVVIRGGNFDFGLIYRIGLPLMVGALIILSSLGFFGETLSNLFAAGGYTALSILTMVIFANICYRYGVSAIWLFGIERGVRAIFMMLGRRVQDITLDLHFEGMEGSTIVVILTMLAVIVGTMVFMTERDLSSRWGAHFLSSVKNTESIIKKQELADRCDALAKEYRLSAREEEVLLLLAQRKTVGVIERELFIANGTAKAHIRHIYKKLDIHSREALLSMLGIEEYEDKPSQVTTQENDV